MAFKPKAKGKSKFAFGKKKGGLASMLAEYRKSGKLKKGK